MGGDARGEGRENGREGERRALLILRLLCRLPRRLPVPGLDSVLAQSQWAIVLQGGREGRGREAGGREGERERARSLAELAEEGSLKIWCSRNIVHYSYIDMYIIHVPFLFVILGFLHSTVVMCFELDLGFSLRVCICNTQ